MSDWREKHYAWRKRVARNMPNTAARVFALRGRPYMGYGFHYALEKQLGAVMRMANDYDQPLTVADKIVVQLRAEALFSDLVKAERSAADMESGAAEISNHPNTGIS